MSVVFKRYDVRAEYGYDTHATEDAEGEYVKAQDAYDKCAVLSAEIATLKTQLKDAQADARHWKANHDAQVARARVLIERTDLPLERVAAYQRLTQGG